MTLQAAPARVACSARQLCARDACKAGGCSPPPCISYSTVLMIPPYLNIQIFVVHRSQTPALSQGIAADRQQEQLLTASCDGSRPEGPLHVMEILFVAGPKRERAHTRPLRSGVSGDHNCDRFSGLAGMHLTTESSTELHSKRSRCNSSLKVFAMGMFNPFRALRATPSRKRGPFWFLFKKKSLLSLEADKTDGYNTRRRHYRPGSFTNEMKCVFLSGLSV